MKRTNRLRHYRAITATNHRRRWSKFIGSLILCIGIAGLALLWPNSRFQSSAISGDPTKTVVPTTEQTTQQSSDNSNTNKSSAGNTVTTKLVDSNNPGKLQMTDCPEGTYLSGTQCEDIPKCLEFQHFDEKAEECVANTVPDIQVSNSGMTITVMYPVGKPGGMSANDLWAPTWDKIKSLDYPDFTGDAPEECYSHNRVPMDTEIKKAGEGSGPTKYANLFPIFCSNDKYIWQCVKQNTDFSPTDRTNKVAYYLKITCIPPVTQSDVDNGHATDDATGLSGAVLSTEEFKKTVTDSTDHEEDSCEAGFLGFGWIFCPGQNLLTTLIDGLMGLVSGSMEWRVLADQAGSNGRSIQDVWMDFLDIANILFAIVFLVMIYSMATSTGLSNYDVKKMLPRLIVVAIAVNISFYICAALVDISNIAGGSMYGLFYDETDKTFNFLTVLGNVVNTSLGIVAGVLALFIFGGAVVVAVLVVVACLAFRQIALVILIVISPIAMALYLLPNTERWAKQWFNIFVRLLIIYPAFTAVWGASRLVSNIAATTSSTGSIGIPGFIIDLACAIAPAVALPSLFKMSGGIMSFAAGAVTGSTLAKKTSSAVGHAARNNAITRKATGFVGKRVGNFGKKFDADSFLGSRLRHLAGAATVHSNGRASNLEYANAFDAQLDTQASQIVSNMDAATQRSVALTGNHGGKQADWRVRKAAIEQLGDLNSAEIEQLIVNANNTANTLSKNNQNAAAQELRDTVYSKVKDDSAYMGDKEFLVNMQSGTIGSNVQQAYDASVISNASDMSKSTLSKTSADSQSYMYDKLKSAQKSGANIDNAVNNLRSAAEQINDDSKTLNSMPASARSALTGINTLRKGAEPKATKALNLDVNSEFYPGTHIYRR